MTLLQPTDIPSREGINDAITSEIAELFAVGGSLHDTGWDPFTGFAAGFVSFDETSNKVMIRQKGNRVYLRGLVKRTSGAVIGSGNVTVATIPAGLTPSMNAEVASPSSANGVFCRVVVQPSGTVLVQNGASVTWVGLTLSWFVD